MLRSAFIMTHYASSCYGYPCSQILQENESHHNGEVVCLRTLDAYFTGMFGQTPIGKYQAVMVCGYWSRGWLHKCGVILRAFVTLHITFEGTPHKHYTANTND